MPSMLCQVVEQAELFDVLLWLEFLIIFMGIFSYTARNTYLYKLFITIDLRMKKYQPKGKGFNPKAYVRPGIPEW